MYVCMHVSMYVCMYSRMYTYGMYMCAICRCIHTPANLGHLIWSRCVCVCVYKHIYIYVQTRLNLESPKVLWRLCMHIGFRSRGGWVCVCMCVYIYMYIHIWKLKVPEDYGVCVCIDRVRAHENRLRAISAGNTYTLPEGHEDNDVPSFWLISLNMNPIPTNPIIQAPKAWTSQTLNPQPQTLNPKP